MNIVNVIFGYVVIINLIGISLIWLNVRTKLIKLDTKVLNIIYIIIAVLGGFLGLLLGSEMMNYERDNTVFKRIIPFIVFVYVASIVYYVYKMYT